MKIQIAHERHHRLLLLEMNEVKRQWSELCGFPGAKLN
jgi:hypothetical protein